MTAFATYLDLGTRLGVTYTPDQQGQVTVLLEDAAAFMRREMDGNVVYPSQSSTYIAYPMAGRATIPQMFVRSVDAVTDLTGTAVTFTVRKETVCVSSDKPIKITYTAGLPTVPSDLVGINCALAAQMLTTIGAGLGLNAAGLSSVAIDDFKAAFADGGVGTGLSMTDTTRDYIKRNYGRTAWVVSTW